jgi:hypothetical protein
MKLFKFLLLLSFWWAPVSAQYIASIVEHVAAPQVLPGTNDNPVIRIKIEVGPLSETLNALFISPGITTNPAGNILATNIYYTGSSTLFSTTQLYTGAIMPLASGNHFFWVAYNLTTGAAVCDTIDAECYTVYVSSGTQTPAVVNPPEFALVGNCITSFEEPGSASLLFYIDQDNLLQLPSINWNLLEVISVSSQSAVINYSYQYSNAIFK